MMQVAVMISGRGSNLEALIKHQQGYQIKHVISNNFDAKGIGLAKKHGITNTIINWSNPQQAESMLAVLLDEIKVDLIVLAGFMRILSQRFIKKHNNIINIHPSLLPKYPGLNTHQKAIDNNDEFHGATVHVVNEELDSGLMLTQTRFKISRPTTAEQLADELISKEHKLLTTTVGLIATETINWTKENLFYKNQKITPPLQINAD